ncbi:low molecular weight phosphotyrosine protein phosphatase [Candidatus Methylospira mobilis]|uniref:protein-tyrosine-phosphatase n=1 Tax=Candidatus Methylospira mobilis TaxID=1808979 RepID=A0A5Q0BI09_9GAMM|nr:low molecular weight protein-tyrosine-phosphatase [Candidatus Methylospira mobilis]QFY43199.1 low molecular weight phosphotyrosine protein phosphatase [Candidatus Methylospira mobilis]WNV03595.1 low molecular weight protein-tyrosine-phosphatase [Candidatus Methylospira mobilis]
MKILFVCMGNICRSPSAEGIFQNIIDGRGVADLFELDSAGTHGYHAGSPPDQRAQKAALARGIDLSRLRARSVEHSDFEIFDHILAMDHDNLSGLLSMSPKQYAHKVELFLNYAPEQPQREVPDPYYGGAQGFEHVLDLITLAGEGLLTASLERMRS